MGREYLKVVRDEILNLAEVLEKNLRRKPVKLRNFKAAHSTFIKFVDAYSQFCEDLNWIDFNRGIIRPAHNAGFTSVKISVEAFKKMMVIYRAFLKSDNPMAFYESRLLDINPHPDFVTDKELLRAIEQAKFEHAQTSLEIRALFEKCLPAHESFMKADLAFLLFNEKFSELCGGGKRMASLILYLKQATAYSDFLSSKDPFAMAMNGILAEQDNIPDIKNIDSRQNTTIRARVSAENIRAPNSSEENFLENTISSKANGRQIETTDKKTVCQIPKPESDERKQIISELEKEVMKDLGKKALLQVDHLMVCNEWAFLRGRPLEPNGNKMDYSKTKYCPEIKEGIFDDGICALMKKYKRKKWQVKIFKIGSIESPWTEWSEKFKAPKEIFK
ncbi:MAG: hypothetical protein HQM08_12950 [Candidatus Riflebacteria bacterium]|nr:hypothetical protein [Candidatus Riflebacteria bacterium]